MANVNALIAQYDKDAPQMIVDYRNAKTKAEKTAVADKAFGKIDAVAKENPKTPAAERANIFLLKKGLLDKRGEYLERIRRDHIDSSAVVEILGHAQFFPDKKAGALFLQAAAASPNLIVREATALMLVEEKISQQERLSRNMTEVALKPRDAATSGVIDELNRIKKAIGIRDIKLFNDKMLAAQVDFHLATLTLVGAGSTVPEIKAADADDKEFKLSDYRGKVVLLDFWGFW